MYERFYGLRQRPFSIAPQAEFLYPSRRHRQALELLRYGIDTRAPFVVVTGEIGTGKTTLLRHLLGHLDPGQVVASVAHAHGEYANLLRWIADAQGLAAGALEKLRLLSNINGEAEAPFQVMLVGQRELRERLGDPSLAQLAQRVVVDYHLEPLERDEIAPY